MESTRNPIHLTRPQIEAALPQLATDLRTYAWIQAHCYDGDLRGNGAFRKRFTAYYRLRRTHAWQDHFYTLMEQFKGTEAGFPDVFDALCCATGQYEASFASKLLATLNPQMPIIDVFVLKHVGLRLPRSGAWHTRVSRIRAIYASLQAYVADYLTTETGKYLVQRFREMYPDLTISEVKMLDFVLWHTRAADVC